MNLRFQTPPHRLYFAVCRRFFCKVVQQKLELAALCDLKTQRLLRLRFIGTLSCLVLKIARSAWSRFFTDVGCFSLMMLFFSFVFSCTCLHQENFEGYLCAWKTNLISKDLFLQTPWKTPFEPNTSWTYLMLLLPRRVGYSALQEKIAQRKALKDP